MFCAPRLIFCGTEGVGSRFNVLCARTCSRRYRGRPALFHVLRVRNHFRRYRGRRVPFSYFALPDSFSAVPTASGPISCFAGPKSFSAVPRASGLVFLFCAPGLVFSGVECVGSLFHVLRSRNHFRRYRGSQVQFSCFARPDSFSTVPRASGPVLMFCALGLVFNGTKGVGSRFHVLRAHTRLRR
jgi:hypothetical protein